ncbi:glycoside hydrolase family 3 protein [Alteromonas gilva]|uniref:Glycoside hydrolase family 3 N-terminal domain-containing protein n=1 Tax=Alteromonas gilva TaxID=2987522 RepID=A0ABT5L877_9ALTE|nr:glycoside hydrolase family 3 N-terminal domain-containing protein [Alteromonas gilva]MDC8832028.1 glycoside hydrolase family 3 N-terminal domain-containing protein [Alteromonas gilva]
MKTLPLSLAVLAFSVTGLAGCSSNTDKNATNSASVPDFWPKIQSPITNGDAVEEKVDALIAGMTVKQKVAQLVQPEIRDITVEDMREYGFGSYLNGGGSFPGANKHATPEEWIALAEAMYQASVDDSVDGSSIPTMWGTDAVHGHNNVIGATLFPHNIGLGAMRDPALVEKIATATAKEVRATGIDWIFAPTVAVVRDDRWGRTYESYSEDPQIVGVYARAIVTGLQGDISDGNIDDQHVISTVKHFVGDGGTDKGDDQGNNLATEKELFDIHAQGYVEGLNAGSQSVMASFNSWQGEKIHGSKYLLTDVLKNKMGFDGFVVGDWNGHGQIPGCSNDNCPQALLAGLDVYMAPTPTWKPLFHNLVAQVESGEIPMARLDDAVRRVLRVKLRVGLFDLPSPANRSLSGKKSVIGAAEHRAIAREAVRKSLVMLKNNQQLLPLKPTSRVLVAGDAAHNIGQQSGGWTITWQGTGNENSDFPGATSIYSGIEAAVTAAGGSAELSVEGNYTAKPDVAIVVFGETPYAEGNGDIANVEYQREEKRDLALLKSLKAKGIPVVSVFITGRPLWVTPEINASDAFVVAWLPGSEGQGVADVLFANNDGSVNFPMRGKLSFSWPATPLQNPVNKGDGKTPLFEYDYGLTYNDSVNLAMFDESVGDLTATMTDHVIFQQSVQQPWQLVASSGDDRDTMNSNVLSVGSVSVRTADRLVQEDTLHIQFGDKDDSIQFFSPFPEDLLDFASAKSALVFDLQKEILGNLNIAMECGGNCKGELALDSFSQQSTEWQTVVVPTACFAQAGVNLKEVYSPMALTSKQAVSVRISNIRLTQMATLPDCPTY